jgi:hypothetical protein
VQPQGQGLHPPHVPTDDDAVVLAVVEALEGEHPEVPEPGREPRLRREPHANRTRRHADAIFDDFVVQGFLRSGLPEAAPWAFALFGPVWSADGHE